MNDRLRLHRTWQRYRRSIRLVGASCRWLGIILSSRAAIVPIASTVVRRASALVASSNSTRSPPCPKSHPQPREGQPLGPPEAAPRLAMGGRRDRPHPDHPRAVDVRLRRLPAVGHGHPDRAGPAHAVARSSRSRSPARTRATTTTAPRPPRRRPPTTPTSRRRHGHDDDQRRATTTTAPVLPVAQPVPADGRGRGSAGDPADEPQPDRGGRCDGR